MQLVVQEMRKYVMKTLLKELDRNAHNMDKPLMRQNGIDTTQTKHYEKDLKSN